MAWKKILLEGDAETEIEAADPLALAGDVSIVGSGKSLELINLKFETATELTIATGDITRTQVYHIIDTEADAASDDLDGIIGGADGMVLIIRPINTTRTVVVRHNQNAATTKNILLANADNVTLDDETDFIMLVYDASLDTNGAWVEVCRGYGAVASLSNTTPQAVGTTAAAGSGPAAARDDHVHDMGVGAIDAANLFASGVVDADAIAAGAVGNSEIDNAATDIALAQLILTPTAAGVGTVEGTIFYDSDDDHLYLYQV